MAPSTPPIVNTNTEGESINTRQLSHSVTLEPEGCDTARRSFLSTCAAWGLATMGPAANAQNRPIPKTPPQPPIPLDPIRLDRGLWWVAADDGDANERNRGHVSHIVLAEQGPSLWAIGSGPSPAFGRRLAELIVRRWPQRRLELISPWAHPESVLGVQGLRPARHWAHREVAHQMSLRCEGCLQRLAHRMGAAAIDLQQGASASGPIEIPTDLFEGERGSLGPFQWQRLQRASDVTVTLWRLPAAGLVFAPGLLWGAGPPDARDADLEVLLQSSRRMARDPVWASSPRVLGQQGRVEGSGVWAQAVAYWEHIQAQALRGQEEGEDGMQPPPCPKGVSAAWCDHERHALNWQRAWRQAESRWLQRSFR